MNEELIPIFLMNGEEIGDVAYLPYREHPEGVWNAVGSTELKLTHDIDRAIFESPVGCYEMRLKMNAGQHLTLTSSARAECTIPLTPCQRTRPIEQEASVAH